jgi:hypothetical protein
MRQVNGQKLQSFIGKMLGSLDDVFSAPTVLFGFRLGLFGALYRFGEPYRSRAATAAAKVSAVVAAGGFSKVWGATEGSFNRVLEARM